MKKPFTKIIATLGPASESKECISMLARMGANLFRLNFSHGTLDDKKENIKKIRAAEKTLKTPIGIICDMQGPKLRVGEFKNGSVTLKTGQAFRLDMDQKPGDETRVCLPHQEIFDALKKNTYLLVNDGAIRLKVTKVGKDCAETTVVVGGVLSDHKGVNVPGVSLDISPLTPKDHKDLKAALDMGTDWIALSFVQRPEDVLEAKAMIKGRAKVITKIEKPSALQHLEKIIDVSDAIMVARGDLGVETPLEHLPVLQKHIVALCRTKGKPVIVATQMLESMIKNPTPTRAEVSDVATAVYDGVDCVMLSGETAVGAYPELAVSVMRKITLNIESDPLYKKMMEVTTLPPDTTIASAVTSAIAPMMKVLTRPACVVTYSVSGSTTLRVAHERPGVPILNLTQEETVMRQMTLLWGVYSVKTKTLKTLSDVSPIAELEAKKFGFAKPGSEILVTAGIPFAKAGNTNIIHILTVK